ncbi:MAG TPA: cation:proton antiporter [Gemmatimonadaceae bacterium]|nr:cation:proton antiporter [Gemmatimonadaceae bacterium]
MEHFITTLALTGIVIVVASLLSGAVERSGVPLVAVFLALGAALGPFGLGLADIELASPALKVIATLALALVLFSDAVTIEIGEVRARKRLAARLLIPGTFVPAVVITAVAHWLLGLQWAESAILGAALASTDPVLLRSVLRAHSLPDAVRVALRLESGMNDVMLLPIVVLSMLLIQGASQGGGTSAGTLVRHAIGLFVLGPTLGALIGWLGIVAMVRVRSGVGVRRDYESLYALGLAFTAYTAAEAVGGSGFLAAFAAGFMVAAQDVELCDCFLEYGEATAEMLLLLTFVALGTSVIWSGLTVISGRVLLFAAIALVTRTAVLLPMLRLPGVGLAPRERRLIALFGPRGLSTLLFALLPVFAGLPGAGQLFEIACLVVLLSVVVHGGGIALFLRAQQARDLPPAAPRPRPVAAPPTPNAEPAADDRIGLDEVRELRARGGEIVIVDARADRSYRASDAQAAGSVRISPDDPVRDATALQLSRHATLVVYCA